MITHSDLRRRPARFILVSLVAAVVLVVLVSGRAEGDGGEARLTATVDVFEEQLDVELRTEPSGEIEQGTVFRVIARITNLGTTQLSSGEVSLHVDVSGLHILGPNSFPLPPLSPGASRRVLWTAHAAEIGIYVMTVEAGAVDESGASSIGEASTMLTVIERSRPGGGQASAGADGP